MSDLDDVVREYDVCDETDAVKQACAEAEVKRLRKAVDEADKQIKENLEWFDNAQVDYKNGNVFNGVDEGEYYGWKAHKEIRDNNSKWLKEYGKE